MERANFSLDRYKQQDTKACKYEWQQRALDVQKELKIPDTCLDKKTGKPIPLKSILFNLFKFKRTEAEVYYDRSKDKDRAGAYFCALMLKKRKYS